MAAIIYNKLVRDKIPEIIEADGKSSITHIATEDEYLKSLQQKLREEVEEFIEEPCEEELADILEVIDGLMKVYGYSKEAVQGIQKEKANKRGKFEKRIILESVNDD